MSFLILAGLLVLPCIAGFQLVSEHPWVVVFVLVLNGLTYRVYGVDKRRAKEGSWRIPEANLHLLELLGGWPGAFLAQRRLRHKCSKRSYQFIFWLIVLAYQLAAYDSLQNWQYTRSAVKYIEQLSHERR